MTARLALHAPWASLGLLFGWILAFPMFGPKLVERAAEAAGSLGLWFLAGSIAGYGLAALGHRGIPSPQVRWALASVLAAGTTALLLAPWPGAPAARTGLMLALGASSALLVIDWTGWLARQPRPYFQLAAAMTCANLILLLALLPGLWPPASALTLVLLPLAAAYCWPPAGSPARPSPPAGALDRLTRNQALLALGAFAVVAYFVGGLWYRVYAVPSLKAGTWLAALDILWYIAAIAALAGWLSSRRGRRDLGLVAVLTLSFLGAGLALAQLYGGYYPRILISLGLAGADYYYWLALWSLARHLPASRVFGWGLGFSLVQISLASLLAARGVVRGYPREVVFGAALALTMLLLPLLLGSRFQLGPERSRPPVPPPAGLTDSERRVFALLAGGASDQDIAGELFISRHTVKFHVRNILQKYGAPNRKVLLSRLRTDLPWPGDEEE